MATFGPFYPWALQERVNHAERLAEQLRRLETDASKNASADPEASSRAEVWLHGRADEIEAYVGDVVDDWTEERLTQDAAADALDRYLDSVHFGMAVALGMSSADCCTPPGETATGDLTPSHPHAPH